ncbi:MAG: hypothetical protein JST54_12360 [Deltaproteobacteria bacterium]|nr:hypothetical protein [Deltaproteobacteria bacterium]
MRLASLLLLPLALSCAAPLATTAVAVGAASYEREHGRCVAACTPGHQCNAATGLCDPIPCAKGCPAGQACVQGLRAPRCEPTGALTIEKSTNTPNAPEGAAP